jgi:hypothetical protein
MQKLTLIPSGGLANRIYAISSALGYCRDNNIQLRVIWFKDRGMGANFHHILVSNPDIKDVEIIDARWYHSLYNKPRKGNLWLPAIWQRFFFNKRINEFETNTTLRSLIESIHTSACNKIHLISFSLFYEWEGMFDWFKPITIIQNQIDKQISIFSGKQAIGVHIRRSDNERSIAESPTCLFVHKMRQEIETDPSVIFYLASDSVQEKQTLKELFGDKIITPSQKVERKSEQGIINALIELYTLASTRKIYGSSHSTYSALAAKIGKIPMEIPVINKPINTLL